MESSSPSLASNSSALRSGCDEWLDTIFLVLDGLLSGVIVSCNGVACFILLKNTRFRSCFMNTFLVRLAVADILMAVFVMPGEIIFCTGCSRPVSEHCWLIGSVRYFVFAAAKLNLLAITYDRYTAVMSPLKYNAKINFKKVILILTMVWTFPMILPLSRLVWWIKLPKNQASNTDRIFNSGLVFSLVIFPVAVLLVANLRIVLEIRKQHRRVGTMNSASMTETCSSINNARNDHENRLKTSRQAGRKGTTACVLVVFIFVMCWFPRGLYNVFRLFGKEEGPLLNKLGLFFLFVQSAINPFVYSFYRADFRRALIKLLRCR